MFSTMSWTMSRPVTRSLMALALRTPLEQHAHADLGLSRIAEAALDGPVEIEHKVRHLGPLDVAVVGQVEHLDDRLHGSAAGLEVPRDPQLPTEVLLVEAGRRPVVPGFGRALRDGQRADAVLAVGAEAGAPRRGMYRVVAVGEARDAVGVRVREAKERREIGRELALVRDGARPGP